MVRKGWKALDLFELPGCVLLAADPSLAAFGLVLIHISAGRVHILEAKVLSTDETPDKGWESNFTRALLLGDKLRNTIDDWSDDNPFDINFALAVHEAPPAGGGSLMRPESSILGGIEFRRVCSDSSIDMDKLVTPQSHKSLTCGNHIAKKKEHHDAIRNLLPQIHNSAIIKNEALRDALSIGLYAAHRLGDSSAK